MSPPALIPLPPMPIATRFRLAALPWLLIPYDSLTYLLGADLTASAQTLPLTALLSVLYLALRGPALCTSSGSRRVALWLLAAAAAMVLVTAGNIVYEGLASIEADTGMRSPTAMRQGLSLLLGITTYLMFQDALLRLGMAQTMRWVLMGALPSLLLALLQFGTGEFRIQGFSSEPSHLADMLVWALLPACALAAWPRLWRQLAALAGLLTLVGTFSTTGLLKAGVALLAYYIGRGQALRALLVLPLAAGLGAAVLSLFPDNYVFLVLDYMFTVFEDTGELATGSFIDRFFGLAGPVSLLGEWHSWLGYGLGGDTVYFNRLFDPGTADAIRDVKGDIASISSLQGKLLMYGGVWGYALYLGAWVSAWRAAPRGHVARFILVALFVSTLFSLGPLFLPHVWLWLALAATANRT
jgi:hypothetical protein